MDLGEQTDDRCNPVQNDVLTILENTVRDNSSENTMGDNSEEKLQGDNSTKDTKRQYTPYCFKNGETQYTTLSNRAEVNFVSNAAHDAQGFRLFYTSGKNSSRHNFNWPTFHKLYE